MKAQAEPLQSLRLCRCNLVRAAHCVSELDEKPGKTAHTASRNTNKVNPMLFGWSEIATDLATHHDAEILCAENRRARQLLQA